ncbi:uncharacterized protein Dana_GF12601 [Drosophila ananassae]|uniref:Uncharacterized protein n=1 Tax=Drosophila ananassae TaxID=7217 RepID=B3MG08_DROAN|nr:uncharacterized protein LOC6495450 [Drosophila ananassae]EDV35690.1 uncharacterized protein Dana_GF12601 [Drosophila ananassae]
MSRKLNTLVGRTPVVRNFIRSIGMHTKFYADVSSSCHPEQRRTLPSVYLNKIEMMPILETELHPSEWKTRRPKMATTIQRRGKKDHFDELYKKEQRCYSDSYRWSEFRRKFIYGSYV